MILIKAEIKGEPDVPPFTKFFEYPDESDEQIFFSSLELIKEKLSKNLKINTNESLALYCGYVVNQLRARRSIDSIKNNAAKLLKPDNVMVGVPETLRSISFEIALDNLPKKKIIFEKPIPITGLKMAG